MASAATGRAAGLRWLIVGHGSVGAALARRLSRAGLRASVYDPSPRLAVVDGDRLATVASGGPGFDIAVSCVVPAAARDALAAVRAGLRPESRYLEWNTVPPETKRSIAAAAPCGVVDVALLDTLDDEAASPTVAVSGAAADRAAGILGGLGFHVDVVGSACGEAALLKLARSLFMKSLEALVVEFEAAIAPLAGRAVVAASIERNLGERFTAFARMLIETDRIHAARRARELEEAVDIFAGEERSLRVAAAAVEVLRAAAAAWQSPDAPQGAAAAGDLARYLTARLGRGTGRHAAG
jgi:3-hydroxyisobutyrate dehydrogenase-like beta-hydroxyacid dehydrogenase